ncbi:putative methyltransferase [bacterium BMS3Bbin04]|nr:putative methyltransferase [bacterium BMS3Bbin04]
MEKMRMHSTNMTQDNIARIRDLFPGCVTEAHDENGKLKLSVDFDQLRQELSESIVEGPQERYHLNWPGKREALLTANAPIAKTFRPCREESVDFDTTKNLFIEGDNLDALKLLQETYLGKVKMIYIDPPYNTGNDFIYEDDFAENSEEFLKRSNQKDEEGNRLVANTESNGRFHSDWLSMVYPRLKLARNLLKDDGVIFISINDGEAHNVRKACDEIFGGENFKSDISWQKRYTRSNNTVDFTTVIEHIFVYAKSGDFIVNLLPRTEEADARYTNPDNDPRGVWKGASFLNPATPEKRPNLCYPILNPNTGLSTEPTTNAWRRSKEEFARLQEEGILYWGVDGMQPVPSIKMFLSGARGLTPINFWEHEYAGNTDEGTSDLSMLFNAKLFENPKPIRLIKRVIEHACDKESLILDFFAGSATTAHAAMQLNADDGGNRSYIMVQLPESCDEKSEAFKANYKTIAEIGKERIRRAGKMIKTDLIAMEDELAEKEKSDLFKGETTHQSLESEKLDIGFRVLKIDSSNMADIYYTPDALEQDKLDLYADNIKPDRTPEDLLFQVLLDWGVDLSLPIRKETIQKKTVFFVDENALVACFDTGMDEELVKALANYKPLRVVFRDNGFVSDAVKINVEQIFKQMSPSTEVKSI